MPINKTTIFKISTVAALLSLLALAPSALAFSTVPPIGELPSGSNLVERIRSVVTTLLALAAIIAVIYVIIAGVRYITSTGDEEQATKARQSIIYTVIGIIVILLSVVIVNFIGGSV